MSALHELATAAGLQVDWEDAAGEPQRVADDALVAVLAALDLPAATPAEIADSRRWLDEHRETGFLSVDVGTAVALPAGCGIAGTAELILEDGRRRAVAIAADDTGGAGGMLPAIEVAGYHRLVCGARELQLAVAPARCFRVADAAPGRRLWGPAVQIAALRDGRATSHGDFGALAAAARGFAKAGADAMAISPVHALFPADVTRYSPYAPSSRLFLNLLYADPAIVGHPAPPRPAPELIDWETAIPAHVTALRAAFAARSDGTRAAVAAFAKAGGEDLRRHALFDALHGHFFGTGARGWQDWPAEYHDPAGPAVAAFADAHRDEVEFFLFAQWLAAEGLAAAQRAAKDGGMAIGLIADLAVGMDAGGSHAWSRRDDLLTGLSLGAPPDLLGPDGQSWGITGFSPRALRRSGFAPFIATLRAALGHAGGIRIDHALGLRRLWVVPNGRSAKDGAYLTMPMDDMLRILAIESQRARAVVIGEDLGTVPQGLRPAMDAHAILGMRVMWFERDADGGFVAPDRWSADAAAMTGTHDLPTVAGWWQGRDIDWTWDLGRTSRHDEAGDRAERDTDRAALWRALTTARVAEGAMPASDDSAPVVDAALAYVGRTPCALAIVPVEDIAALVEQPNLPGTIDEHPNWRRRLPDTTDAMLADAPVAARIDILHQARSA